MQGHTSIRVQLNTPAMHDIRGKILEKQTNRHSLSSFQKREGCKIFHLVQKCKTPFVTHRLFFMGQSAFFKKYKRQHLLQSILYTKNAFLRPSLTDRKSCLYLVFSSSSYHSPQASKTLKTWQYQNSFLFHEHHLRKVEDGFRFRITATICEESTTNQIIRQTLAFRVTCFNTITISKQLF